MSGSTPSDLAVTFRSLARRQREAIGDVSPASVAGLSNDLDAQIEAAAGVLGVNADAAAIAGAIEARPLEDWDDATINALRQHAIEAGSVLRRIAAKAAELQGDTD